MYSAQLGCQVEPCDSSKQAILYEAEHWPIQVKLHCSAAVRIAVDIANMLDFCSNALPLRLIANLLAFTQVSHG